MYCRIYMNLLKQGVKCETLSFTLILPIFLLLPKLCVSFNLNAQFTSTSRMKSEMGCYTRHLSISFFFISSSSFIFSPPPHSFSSSPPPSDLLFFLFFYMHLYSTTCLLPNKKKEIDLEVFGIQLCFNLHAHAPSLITPASLRFSMHIAMALGRATDASPPSLSPKLWHQTAEFRHWSICLCLC